MCSTPQKQPAATVQRLAPSGMATAPFVSGPRRIVALEKGRVKRERRVFMVSFAAVGDKYVLRLRNKANKATMRVAREVGVRRAMMPM